MYTFKAEIDIIGINPFVFVPGTILKEIFRSAGTDTGPIPIKGTVNSKPYQQTLVKYQGQWRLYINTTMLKNSPKRIGETIEVTVGFDQSDRTIQPHQKLVEALAKDPRANEAFEQLSPSVQKEICRYISRLKSEETIDRNVAKAIDFLLGNGRFVGRQKLK